MPGGTPLSVGQAVECLRQGRIIGYPTEAVYGLGCDPLDKAAVHEILRLKARPARAGLILIADRFERFEAYVSPLPSQQLERAFASWPGPVTWLFPRADNVPDWLAGEHPTIALRVTDHPQCRELCQAFGSAIVSTSANPAGAEPARTAQAVVDYFGDQLCGVVAGELGHQQRPSEIRDLATGRVLRAG